MCGAVSCLGQACQVTLICLGLQIRDMNHVKSLAASHAAPSLVCREKRYMGQQHLLRTSIDESPWSDFDSVSDILCGFCSGNIVANACNFLVEFLFSGRTDV